MDNLYERYPDLLRCRDEIEKAIDLICLTYKENGKLLLCGNGGSSSDCDHMAGELMKSFLKKRKPDENFIKNISTLFPNEKEKFLASIQGGLPAINLSAQVGIMTAFSNDVSGEMLYAQLVSVLAKKNDLLFAISTSGNSENIINALMAAKAAEIKTICLTGKNECRAEKIADITIKVPEIETYKIQELHLPVYHYICMRTENTFFNY